MIFMILVILGWFNIFSAVYSELHPSILDLDQRYGKQFMWIIAALVLAVIVVLIDFRFYEYSAYLFYGISVFMLILLLIIGKEVNGAKSWFAIGSLQIQPSEFAKPAVALALAKYLSTYNINIHKFKTFIITGLIIFSPAILILLQPDTGSALVFFAFILPIYRQGFSAGILLTILCIGILFLLVLLFDELLIFSIILGFGVIIYWIITESYKKTLMIILYYLSIAGIIFGLLYQ